MDPIGHLEIDPLGKLHGKPPGPTPGKGKNRRRPFGAGYLICGGCTPKKDRLSPIPNVRNPGTSPIVGSGPSASENEIFPFPMNPPGAVGTGGAGTCIALIVRCPGFVAVFHFTGGDSPYDTLSSYTWPAGCDSIICGGDGREPQSDCLGDDVMNAATSIGLNVVGVSGNSGCGVDASGDWWSRGT